MYLLQVIDSETLHGLPHTVVWYGPVELLVLRAEEIGALAAGIFRLLGGGCSICLLFVGKPGDQGGFKGESSIVDERLSPESSHRGVQSQLSL
jgi:hypothetical protein